MFKAIDLLKEIRAIRLSNIPGMNPGGAAGLSPRRLAQELRTRVSVSELLALLTTLREHGEIIILAREGFHEGYGPLCVINCPLDETFLMANQHRGDRWRRVLNDQEDYFTAVRIYVVADGLPKTLAKQGVVKRALARIGAVL